MPKPSTVALSLLTVIALGCPAQTTRLPPDHEVVASTPKADTRAPAGDEARGMAGVVADAAQQANAAAEPAEKIGEEKIGGANEKPAAAEPTLVLPELEAGDIPAPPDVAAPPPKARKTASGLAYLVLAKGTGTAKPRSFDSVEVNYTGWTTDGKMFDSSVKRGKPASFGVNRVIKGWTEGLQLMVEGEKTRFWIPAELAYGTQPGRPQGMLVFDVELLKITEGVEPPPAPADVAAPPATATTTASGLAYQVLTPGKGEAHPGEATTVTVHYTGWTTDGTMFDSSVMRGKPASFPLNRVIAGWTEGLQLMVEGEKTRFWIPEASAYQGKPGKPAGMLVFDVELLSIDD